jgi:hypothetical protein
MILPRSEDLNRFNATTKTWGGDSIDLEIIAGTDSLQFPQS